ncbi:MAG TPA: hypothetical protein VLT36_10580 [Candidatus Dormibacteraeota bacterium]|nr:hypothetical protein [Candidatus Dormibacteraeota bacterium]
MGIRVYHFRTIALAVLAISLAALLESPAQPVTPGGVLVQQSIDLNGNNLMVDSYDSSDLNKSWFGQYKPSWYIGDNGNVVCSLLYGAGTANIYGGLSVGTTNVTNIGSQGGIGGHVWQSVNPGTIEPNGMEGRIWFTNDSHYIFPWESVPYTNGILASGPVLDVTSNSSISGTVVTTTVYPTVPFQNLTTNYQWFTNTTLQPPPTCCVVTNPICGAQVRSSSPPFPGFYCPGTLATNNSNRPNIYSWNILSTVTNYTYAVATSFTYTIFTTNTVCFTNTYDHVLTSGDYYYTGALSGSTVVLGAARLSLPDGLNMSGGDSITVNEGASLILYCGGTSCTINGDGIFNQANYPAGLVVIVASSVIPVALNGNAGFRGVLMAPSGDILLNGGGPSAITAFTGLLMANSIKLNGHFVIHYDESLAHQTWLGVYESMAATLSRPTFSGGQARLSVSGVPGWDYIVQASSDLLNWTPLSTNTSPFSFTDPQPASAPQKFYRAVAGP